MRYLSGILLIFLYNITYSQTENIDIYRIVAFQNYNDHIYSISNTVHVVKPLLLYAPNAFSPDGDGVNDHFSIKGQGGEEYYLEIYNRWGQMVFQSEDMDMAWNGEYRGNQSPIGTYVYQVKAINYGGDKIIVKDGSFALIR